MFYSRRVEPTPRDLPSPFLCLLFFSPPCFLFSLFPPAEMVIRLNFFVFSREFFSSRRCSLFFRVPFPHFSPWVPNTQTGDPLPLPFFKPLPPCDPSKTRANGAGSFVTFSSLDLYASRMRTPSRGPRCFSQISPKNILLVRLSKTGLIAL